MDYDTVLAQVLALLQQEQRVAYRILKRRLQLDDETLEDLKDDLIYAKKLAVDEDGRVLVWTGGTSSARTTASPVPLPATPDVSPAQGEAAPVAPPTPEAERRQLTVLFCDLVDSTVLASQLDPEAYRDVVRAYHTACTEVIRRYDGHVAQLLGDGLLIYFGYPVAHEDDAHRAVRTGLGILAAMDDLHARFPHAQGRTLAVRLGIHTGLVVVGAMGDQGRHEHLALGETPNIAARIQGLAQPNTVAISEASSRLVQGYFACQDLGAHALRGVTEAMHIYHVLGESGATSRLEVAQPRGLTPLVGRESEVTLLLERWEQAKVGHGHVVLLSGDGGIGKSRLVQTLKDHVAHEPHTRWECRSVPYYQNTALYPLTDLFQRLLQWQQHDETPDAKLAKLEHALGQYRIPVEDTVPLFAPLLALPVPDNRYHPLTLSPQQQRQKTLETIVAMLLESAEHQPVLFIVEDLHWTDPTTLDLLNLVIEQIPTTSMLVLLTCRPTFHPSWPHRSYVTEVSVTRLVQPQVERMIERVAGDKPLPGQVLAQITAKTDGVPLFVEELTKAVLESGVLQDVDGQYVLTGTLASFAIPATLQDSLMARLDRLVTAKGVAQLGATIGRQFAYDLLQAVAQLDEAMLQHELGRLVEAEIVFQRGVPPQATYTFKHALIQDAAYESLLKSTRQQYHQRIAQVLEAQFPETTEAEPELLAQHYTEAGLRAQAIPFWQRAGQRAIERSANIEAMSHLTTGLELLKTLPTTPEHIQRELALHISLAVPLASTKGWAAPEVANAYARSRELCRQVGETPELFTVLYGLRTFYHIRGELRTARELAEQLLHLAQQGQALDLLLARNALGTTLFLVGELASTRAHLEHGLTLYNPQQYRSHIYLYSLAWALIYVAWFHQFRREGQAAQARAEAAMTLATEQGFAQIAACGTISRGWALAEQGKRAEGIRQMRQGQAALRAMGVESIQSWVLALLAEAHEQGGQAEECLALLAEAFAVVDNNDEHFYEAELYRLKGELTLQQFNVQGAKFKVANPRSLSPNSQVEAEAEACFLKAIDIARKQHAKSLELRAVRSLSRLWQRQGKRDNARERLAEVYGWFTEGFETADLQEAKALLEELGR